MALVLGSTYYKASQDAIVNGHKTASKVWEKFEGLCKIATALKKTDNAFYTPATKSITFSAAKDSVERESRAPWSTMYHEFGHNIDNISCNQTKNNYFSHEYQNGIFPDTIKAEAKLIVNERFRKIKEDFKTLPISEYLEKYKQCWNPWTYKSFKNNEAFAKEWAKPDSQMVCELLANEIRENQTKSKPAISDIFEGATNGRVSDGYGHGKTYWKKSKDNLATEAFANMFSASLTTKEQLEEIRKYFPKSVKIFEQMISELEKRP